MLVLALDTTTHRGSCALVRDGEALREDVSDSERAHATRLPADLMVILARCGLHLRDVDVFAVATGPGSFTGLRIGIATMQGLAFATGRPLVGVSGLDALATIAGHGRVATWVDAWRGEVYAAIYQDGVASRPPIVAPVGDLLQQVEPMTQFIGDGAEAHRSRITTAAPTAVIHTPTNPPLAGMIGCLAYTRVLAGEAPPPSTIRPLYVRRPDAELARQARRGK